MWLNYQDLVHQFSTDPPSQQWRIKFSWSNLDPVPFINITFLALHIAKHIGNYCKLKLLKILSVIEWLVILVGFKIHNKILEICSSISKYIVDLLQVNNPGLSKKSNWLKAAKLCRPSDFFLGWQMPSRGLWEVSKTKMPCKEAGSVQYKAHCKLKLLKILSVIEWLVILVGFKIHNKILEICSSISKYIVDLLQVNNPGLSKKSNWLKAAKLCRPSDFFLG